MPLLISKTSHPLTCENLNKHVQGSDILSCECLSFMGVLFHTHLMISKPVLNNDITEQRPQHVKSTSFQRGEKVKINHINSTACKEATLSE